MDNVATAAATSKYDSVKITSLAFTAIGLFCCFQMFLLIPITFRRYSGLYFWSLLAATLSQTLVCWSIILYEWLLPPPSSSQPAAWLTFASIGYLAYAPCEFLVLYSRLHLLLASRRSLRLALVSIIFEAVVAELPVVVLMILNTVNPESASIARMYDVWCRMEPFLYLAVDTLLCILYFLRCRSLWSDDCVMQRTLKHTISLIIAVLSIDVIYVILSFIAGDQLTTSIEAFLFAFKLLIEIYTLTMLSRVAKARQRMATQIP